MNFSAFGEKFTRNNGILELMDDLGKAAAGSGRICMLGGGNPARIDEVHRVWQESLSDLGPQGLADALVAYDSPRGRSSFIEALAELLKKTFGWDVGPENIAVTNGSQNAFFILFNLFGGKAPDGRLKKILLPLCPEYIGYADQGVDDDIFTTCSASIEVIDDFYFKYHVDFSKLKVSDDVGAICISRPTNPTGNVISDSEVEQLSKLAESAGVPLIIDNAYGAPFPRIIFEDVNPFWNSNTILSMSLSKIGLPSVRSGIIVASPEVIEAVSSCNAIISLATGNVGQVLTEPLFRNGRILDISKDLVMPFYKEKSKQAQEWIRQYMTPEVDFRVHRSEGAIFLWIWFRNLSITSRQLYERLKKRDVLVIPGEPFFFGLDEEWSHSTECIRINYSQDADLVEEGIRIIAEEAAKVVKK